jgi:hypothetical protein
MSDIKIDKKLEVLLLEYKELRNQLNAIQDRQIKLSTIIISALIIGYGIIFIQPITIDMILIIPFLTLALGFMFQYEKYKVWVIGKYLEKIEEKIGKIIGSKIYDEEDLKNIENAKGKIRMIGKNVDWSGFQTYMRTLKEFTFEGRLKEVFYYILPTWLIFFSIPMGISALYSFLIITGVIQNINSLPSEIYIILLIVYFLFMVGSPLFIYGLDKSDKIRKKFSNMYKIIYNSS